MGRLAVSVALRAEEVDEDHSADDWFLGQPAVGYSICVQSRWSIARNEVRNLGLLSRPAHELRPPEPTLCIGAGLTNLGLSNPERSCRGLGRRSRAGRCRS